MFKPTSSKVNFPKLEEEILLFWKGNRVFQKGSQDRPGAPLFVLYEGPPTANGSPGLHHVLARVFKDIIPRYKTMKGYRVLRKGGWDTHGLPVELEVERQLGFSSKAEIEAYGVANFNQKCRESVFRYLKDWETLTERIAFWVDMENAYITFTPEYIESCWWIIKTLWDAGLIYNGMKVTPHCPRCVTTLSSHEVALGYKENTPDPSIYVKFEVDLAATQDHSEDLGKVEATALQKTVRTLKATGKPVYLLAWTTTPWTLPGNTALAIDPDAEYALVKLEHGDLLLMASRLLTNVLKHEYTIKHTFRGEQLKGLTYKPLYDPSEADLPMKSLRLLLKDMSITAKVVAGEDTSNLRPDMGLMAENAWRVYPASFVSMEEGTGIVHIAPAFGQEDFDLGAKHELLFVQQVDLQGKIIGGYPGSGKFVKDADEDIMADLASRNLLYRREVVHHTYPFCWRCDTPLLYYAKPSWYIRTTAVKQRLLSANQDINWYPEYIKEGRFGEWLENNVDWAISRERFWGTPIPIWQCASCGTPRCIGSLKELTEAVAEMGNSHASVPEDLHRPFVDEVELICQSCQGRMRRIPEVMDVWFDSGAMPLAQFHYPFENTQALSDGRYPGDYICEAVDQTRGWFYSLHAIATLLEHATGGKISAPSYRNVICLGLIQDQNGEKMSKSRGNVIDPWKVMNTHGADALRWYLFIASPPGNSRRFSVELVGEALRSFQLTLWNTYSFFVTYANIDRFHPEQVKEVVPTAPLDRWLLSELHQLVRKVTTHLDSYNPTDAGRCIAEFVDALSNWYVRRSRRRFWKSEGDEDKKAAYHTLYQCLVTLCKLMAPFTPFLAEEMYQNLVCSVDSSAPISVHLAEFPTADASAIDPALSQAVSLAMRLSSLGRAARGKAAIKVRQPLAKAFVKLRSPQEEAILAEITPQVLDELNVKELEVIKNNSRVSDYEVKANMALLGPKYGRNARHIAHALSNLSPNTVAALAEAGNLVEVSWTPGAEDKDGPRPGAQAEIDRLLPEEITLHRNDRPGYAVAMEGSYTVAVATEITAELKEEGLARELVHSIQNMRRTAGFDIVDHIVTYYQGDPELRKVMQHFSHYIQQETLSQGLLERKPPEEAHVEVLKLDGQQVTLGVHRVATS